MSTSSRETNLPDAVLRKYIFICIIIKAYFVHLFAYAYVYMVILSNNELCSVVCGFKANFASQKSTRMY